MVSLTEALDSPPQHRISVQGCVMTTQIKDKGIWLQIYDHTNTRFMVKFWNQQSHLVTHIQRDMDIRVFNVRIDHYTRSLNGQENVLISGNSLNNTRVEIITRTDYNVEAQLRGLTLAAIFVDGQFLSYDENLFNTSNLQACIGRTIFYDIVEDWVVDIRDQDGRSMKLSESTEEESDVDGDNVDLQSSDEETPRKSGGIEDIGELSLMK